MVIKSVFHILVLITLLAYRNAKKHSNIIFVVKMDVCKNLSNEKKIQIAVLFLDFNVFFQSCIVLLNFREI